jgi:hypothetical protein
LLTYGILSSFGSTTGGEGDWTGIALLLSVREPVYSLVEPYYSYDVAFRVELSSM